MISLIRKCSRNVNLSAGLLATISQVQARLIPRFTSTSNNLQSADFATKSRKNVACLKTSSRKPPVQQNEYPECHAVIPDILRDLREIVDGYKQRETSAWLTRTLEYNLRNAENNIVLLSVLTYEHLVKSKNLNSENMRLAYILGWCSEMLNTCILMYDDIMDNGTYRRGQPCWHTLKDVGLAGLNDAFMIENAVYALLKKHFRHLECYTAILEVFHEVSFIAACGQSLDLECAKKTVNAFNMETYKIMAVNKATYDNFYLPFAVAMHLAGFTDEEAFRQSKAIIFEIGIFFQIQNDFLDCFGTPESAGKIGTDIQDNKYSWLAIACMVRANDEQKQTMMDCYGQNDPEKIQQVKDVYRALDLPGVYAAYEEESYNNTKALIEQTSNGVPHEIFLTILNKIYRRDP